MHKGMIEEIVESLGGLEEFAIAEVAACQIAWFNINSKNLHDRHSSKLNQSPTKFQGEAQTQDARHSTAIVVVTAA